MTTPAEIGTQLGHGPSPCFVARHQQGVDHGVAGDPNFARTNPFTQKRIARRLDRYKVLCHQAADRHAGIEGGKGTRETGRAL